MQSVTLPVILPTSPPIPSFSHPGLAPACSPMGTAPGCVCEDISNQTPCFTAQDVQDYLEFEIRRLRGCQEGSNKDD